MATMEQEVEENFGGRKMRFPVHDDQKPSQDAPSTIDITQTAKPESHLKGSPETERSA
jgi:hypothetical protein